MGKLMSIWLIEIIVNIYDFVTLPVYFIIQKPWQVRRESSRIRAKMVDKYTWANVNSTLDKKPGKSVNTLDELFRESVRNYATRNCLGVRKVLAVEYKELAPAQNGTSEVPRKTPATKKIVSKYVMDDQYTWYSYAQIEQMVVQLSAGLIDLCGKSILNSDGSRKVLICADTCMEWFLIAHACFRNNITVVTAYTTLDDDAIVHTMQQTGVKMIVVSQKIMSRVVGMVERCPEVDTVIQLDEPLPGEEEVLKRELDRFKTIQREVTTYSYDQILTNGFGKRENILNSPKSNDTAVLMYTSGSTGKPKGVILTHESIVYTALSFSGPGHLDQDDRYIGYLPLGHVLELAAECIFLRNGSTIAYSSPATLTSGSPMIKKGQKGDAVIFKPTIMGAVPLVLDRIRSAIKQKVKSQGPFYDQLINDFVIRYKRYWFERYYSTPIMNYLICKNFNMIFGGQMRAICSGGAALSRETQEYLRHVTNNTVLQGYGLTETSAAASFCDVEERRYNVVGAPYPAVHLKLESWSDYSTEDKPYPRGEVIIGGPPVCAGYYKQEELNKEAFFVDPKTGMRFFRSGDIGMMLPDGVLKIIDRKKDIVKPLSGEYISLSEIETAMRTLPIIENICVYCSQYSNYIVALVKPDARELKAQAYQFFVESSEMAEKFRQSVQKAYSAESHDDSIDGNAGKILKGKRILDRINIATLCSNKWLVERILKLLQDEGAMKKLKRTQIPSKIRLCHHDWTPESGLATASFKLRRRELVRFYAEDIKQLYAELGQKIEHEI